ncbi:MAG: hypothetical protein RMH77_07360 [Sulfolobales archaeon]|nr:hypothetical protein [Sulfolobales archaeon]MDW7970197.1 hypothetical protein [Sulfolobales archaeon]
MEKILVVAIIAAILLSNPPILTYVNEYCKTSLLTYGVPTLWLYLTSIWGAVVVLFIITAALNGDGGEGD